MDSTYHEATYLPMMKIHYILEMDRIKFIFIANTDTLFKVVLLRCDFQI